MPGQIQQPVPEAPLFNLAERLPGGSWSGSLYVTPSGIFNPNAAGVGTFKLYYTAGTGICISRDSVLVNVVANPTANAGADAVLCQATGTIQLTGLPAGGAWSGSPLVTAVAFSILILLVLTH